MLIKLVSPGGYFEKILGNTTEGIFRRISCTISEGVGTQKSSKYHLMKFPAEIEKKREGIFQRTTEDCSESSNS